MSTVTRRPLQLPAAARRRLLAAGEPGEVLGVAGQRVALDAIPCFGVVHWDRSTEWRETDRSCQECLAQAPCRRALNLFAQEMKPDG